MKIKWQSKIANSKLCCKKRTSTLHAGASWIKNLKMKQNCKIEINLKIKKQLKIKTKLRKKMLTQKSEHKRKHFTCSAIFIYYTPKTFEFFENTFSHRKTTFLVQYYCRNNLLLQHVSSSSRKNWLTGSRTCKSNFNTQIHNH